MGFSNSRNKFKSRYKYCQVYCIVKHTNSMQYLVWWVTNGTYDCDNILYMRKYAMNELVARYDDPWDSCLCNKNLQ